jgi:hypothetical protein
MLSGWQRCGKCYPWEGINPTAGRTGVGAHAGATCRARPKKNLLVVLATGLAGMTAAIFAAVFCFHNRKVNMTGDRKPFGTVLIKNEMCVHTPVT